MGCVCGTYGDEEKCKENFVWKLEEKISWKTNIQIGAAELVWEGFIVDRAVIANCFALR